MTQKIIAVGGQKGGAGKSTVVLSLAVALAEAGTRVILIDADSQGTLSTWYQSYKEGAPAGFAQMTLQRVGEADVRTLLEKLRAQDGEGGLVLVDLDGRNSAAQRAAMTVVDLFLIPVRPGAADVWALGDMIELVAQAAQLNPRLTSRIVLNAMDRTQFARDVRASLRDVPIDVLNAELGYRIDYRESMGAGEGPTLYKPDEKAAHEVRALVKELKALLTEEG